MNARIKCKVFGFVPVNWTQWSIIREPWQEANIRATTLFVDIVTFTTQLEHFVLARSIRCNTEWFIKLRSISPWNMLNLCGPNIIYKQTHGRNFACIQTQACYSQSDTRVCSTNWPKTLSGKPRLGGGDRSFYTKKQANARISSCLKRSAKWPQLFV